MYRSLGKYKYESLQIYVEAEEDLKSAYLEGFFTQFLPVQQI
jgi:hypothetical protein